MCCPGGIPDGGAMSVAGRLDMSATSLDKSSTSKETLMISAAGGVTKLTTSAPANKFVLPPTAPLYIGFLLIFLFVLLNTAHAESVSKDLQTLRREYTALETLYNARVKDIQNFEKTQGTSLLKADTDYYNSTLSFIKEAMAQNLKAQHKLSTVLQRSRKNFKPPSTITPQIDARARFYNL
jgi:hypothetical protein